MKKIFLLCLSIIILLSESSLLFALQDEMAIGKFVGNEAGVQILIFHFHQGKTHLKFFEKLPNSSYLFPVYEILLFGQLKQKPLIEDLNRDGLLDIKYSTTSESGILYFDQESNSFVKSRKKKLKKKTVLTKEEELRLLRDID